MRGGWPAVGRSGGVHATERVLGKRECPRAPQTFHTQEVKLWVKLRELKKIGFHFRRQAPIGKYIVDFVSFGTRTVIEIDGGQHGMEAGIRLDQDRDTFLRSRGFSVLRFWNSDVDRNLNGVMESILIALNTPTPTG